MLKKQSKNFHLSTTKKTQITARNYQRGREKVIVELRKTDVEKSLIEGSI